MPTNTQGHRSWNAFQSVAGRSCESIEGGPCGMESTILKQKSSPWLMRTPAAKYSSFSYSRNLTRNGPKCTYAISHPFIADGDIYADERIMSSIPDEVDYDIHFSPSSDISEVDHDFNDFEDTESESDAESDVDSEAQYITIPTDSPWWRAPRSSDGPYFDTFIDGDLDDRDCIDDPPSSHSLSLILEKQQFLVGLFHDELRRMMPGDARYECNDDWLKEVDAKLLLAPVEVFEETCKGSVAKTSRPLSMDFGSKPVPDVPVDFEDEDDDGSLEDWDYPLSVQHVHFVEAHSLDPRSTGQKIC